MRPLRMAVCYVACRVDSRRQNRSNANGMPKRSWHCAAIARRTVEPSPVNLANRYSLTSRALPASQDERHDGLDLAAVLPVLVVKRLNQKLFFAVNLD